MKKKAFRVTGLFAVLFCIGMVGMATPVLADGGPFNFNITGYANYYRCYVQNPDLKVYGYETSGSGQVVGGTYVQANSTVYLSYYYGGYTWVRLLQFTSGSGGNSRLYRTASGTSLSLWSTSTFTFSTSSEPESTEGIIEEEME